MTHISSFPPEIMTCIVSHVDRRDLLTLTRVNTQCYMAANPLLWHSIHLQHRAAGLLFLARLVTARRSVGQCVRSVHLEHFTWTNRTLLLLMKRTPCLTSLVLDNASRVTDEFVQHLSHYWPHLQSLYLATSPITHVSYHVLGQQCRQLTHLELWNCPGLQPDTFSVHFANSRLEKLMIATWPDEDEQAQEPRDTWSVFESTVNLTTLHYLQDVKIHGAPFGMLQHVLDQGIQVCWPHLTSLELEACFDMTDEVAMALMREIAGHRLTRLALKDACFTDVTLATIATHQPTLIELDVSANNNITACGIRHLVHRCHALTLVTIAYCGIHLSDFDDASGPQQQCRGVVRTSIGLSYLDQQAIDIIRQTGNTT